MKSVTVSLLAYKEAENLAVLLPEIHEQMGKIGADYEIVVIDTKEPLDNTEEVCRKLNARYVNQRGRDSRTPSRPRSPNPTGI